MESQTARGGRGDNAPAPWQHLRGDLALARDLGYGLIGPDDSVDLLGLEESPADEIDREMEERGHLLHAIEPSEEELDAARRHASAAVVSEIARIRAMEASGACDEEPPLVATGVSAASAVIGTLCLLAGAVWVVWAIVGGGA